MRNRLKNFFLLIYNKGKKLVIHNAKLTLSLFFLVIAICFVVILTRDSKLANAIVAFGTLILALVAALSILNSNEREKHRREEVLLKEIVDWLLDIRDASLIKITPGSININDVERVKLEHGFDVLQRYRKAFNKAPYIELITETNFKKTLYPDIRAVVVTLTGFLFLEELMLGLKDPIQQFGGEAALIVKEVEKELRAGKKTTRQLRDESSGFLAAVVVKLLQTIGTIDRNY